MRHKLTSLCTGAGDTETVNYVVETSFDEFHKFLTGDATTTGSLGIKFTELAFENTVGVFGFLFFLKLNTVFRGFATAFVLAVHARSVIFSFKSLIRTVNGFVEFSSDFGFRTSISCHCIFRIK